MKGKKNYSEAFFRVIGTYKNPMLLGFFLGISLVLVIILANQVTGIEKKPITLGNTSTNTLDQTNKRYQITEPVESQENQGAEDTNTDSISNTTGPGQIYNDNDFEDAIPTFNKKNVTVLLVGVDQRPNEKTLSNTDTLLVANINTVDGHVTLLSIPRDTQVIIPGYGKEKINAAARLGKGIKTTQDLVEEIIGQSIDGYVITNFEGFKEIIDSLGGITLTVEKNMVYDTGDMKDGVINLKKGTQRLNGTQALQYARFRQDALADISRVSRQQAVLKAIEKEFLQVKTLPKLPGLISQMTKSVETDLSAGQIWSLVNILIRFKSPQITSQTLPGNFLIEDDISYWKINPFTAHNVVERLIEEGKTTSVFFH